MPKMKTKKAAAKRFTVLSSGKIKRAQAYKAHILTKKSRKRLNKLRTAAYVHKSNVGLILACLPYR